MRNLIVILSVFLVITAVQINTAQVTEAGIGFPEDATISAAVVCQFRQNQGTYNVVLAELASPYGDDDDDLDECLLPPACDNGEACAGCLTAMSFGGFYIEESNEVTNNRVVYILNTKALYFECFDGDDDDDDTDGGDGP